MRRGHLDRFTGIKRPEQGTPALSRDEVLRRLTALAGRAGAAVTVMIVVRPGDHGSADYGAEHRTDRTRRQPAHPSPYPAPTPTG